MDYSFWKRSATVYTQHKNDPAPAFAEIQPASCCPCTRRNSHDSPLGSDEQLKPRRIWGRQRDSSLVTGNSNSLPSCTKHHGNVVLATRHGQEFIPCCTQEVPFEVLLLLPLLRSKTSYCFPLPKPYTAHWIPINNQIPINNLIPY